MKKLSLAVLAVGLIATMASADVTSSSLTEHPGTFGAPTVNIDEGIVSIAIESLDGGRSTPYALGSEGYDNWPSIFGGAGASSVCVGTQCTLGTWAFFDWATPGVQWGDDVHGYTSPNNTMDHLHYGFLDVPAGTGTHVVQHTIKIYDMFPPSVGHSPPTFSKGVLYTSLHVTYTLTNTGNTFYTADVNFVPVALVSDSMWVKFVDPADGTYWLTGGKPTIAPNYSHPGIVYGAKSYTTYSGYTYNLNYFVAWPYLSTSTGALLNSNIALALGYIPEPATISLLALSGVLVLRRRRVRA